MRKLLSVCLMLLNSLPAGAQQGFASDTQISVRYSTLANTSAWPASDSLEDLREELRLAFATGPATDVEIELVPETGDVLLQIPSGRERSKMIPLQIVASATDTSDVGLAVMMDGLVVANSGSHALLPHGMLPLLRMALHHGALLYRQMMADLKLPILASTLHYIFRPRLLSGVSRKPGTQELWYCSRPGSAIRTVTNISIRWFMPMALKRYCNPSLLRHN